MNEDSGIEPFNVSEIPVELQDYPNWVVWRWEGREGKKTERPYNPVTGRRADPTIPSSWNPFGHLLSAYDSSSYRRERDSHDSDRPHYKWNGIGFVFTESDPFFVVVLDECRKPKKELIKPYALRIIDNLSTYAEVSPSGTGVHIIGKGTLPYEEVREGRIKVIERRCFIPITGDRVPGCPSLIRLCTSEIEKVYRFNLDGLKPRKKGPRKEQEKKWPSDEQVLDVLYRTDRNGKFRILYEDANEGGHLRAGYSSKRQADFALAMRIVWVTRYRQQIQRLMVASSLGGMRYTDEYLKPIISRALKKVKRKFNWDEDLPLTDTGNAQRFVRLHGENVRYCHPWKKWLVWDDHRWHEDDTGDIVQMAKQVAQSLRDRANKTDSEKYSEMLRGHANRTESAAGLTALLKCAQDEAWIPVLPENLDRDGWLLNCRAGTLDLEVGRVRDARRENYITKHCTVLYDPKAKCEVWLKFLGDIFGRYSQMIHYLQRLLGYFLTGQVSEQILPIFYGKGSNGKSTLVNTILTMMGPDYAIKAAPDLLMAKQGAHPTERADLFGKRLVVCSEIGEGCKLNETLVKDLTGGDRIRARRLYENFWEFNPTHKIILVTNHKPKITGTDHAIWRRLRLIPFTVTIPDEKQDKQLSERLREELPGILAWCVKGCLQWQRKGLQEPYSVLQATSEYREEEDVMAKFIEAKCDLDEGNRESAKELYDAYCGWAEQNGEFAISQKLFGEALTRRGIDRRKVRGRYWRIGIGLRKSSRKRTLKRKQLR